MKLSKWIKKNNQLIITKDQNGLIIQNISDQEQKVYSPKILKWKNKYLNVVFNGKIIDGSGAILTFLNRKKVRRHTAIFNSESSSRYPIKGMLLPIIIIKPKTTIIIEDISVNASDTPTVSASRCLGKKDILLITPSYPSPDNLYACGFVHTRVKAYQEAGLEVEVASIYYNEANTYYNIDGVDVFKTDYQELRNILMAKSYKAVLMHFLDANYASYLETSYLNETPVFLWNHGADILYGDYKEFCTPYFATEYILPSFLEEEYNKRDQAIPKLLENKNIHWIFVSNWEKKRAEELHECKFENSIVIPNLIDSKIFDYNRKDIEQRKKIFLIRRFDNTKKYAIDLAVLTILELSRRPFFNELEFYLCGEGDFHSQLVEPLRGLENVHILNTFFSHEQIHDLHKECGIALFPTRQDTQGVSALEAAASGLAVITSDIEVIREYFDPSLNTLCPVENIKSYADTIERLYKNPKEFSKISESMSKNTNKICGKENTINREIEFINEHQVRAEDYIAPIKEISDKPLLTIAIPSYNAEKYLDKCLLSLLQNKYIEQTEILVINDGSKDRTKEIGEKYQKLTTKGKKSIVKLVDKENGGHGSGINKGIELAKGKYFKVVDSDDWLDPKEYEQLLEKLQTETSDLILCDYQEARSFEDKPYSKEYYNFLTPDVEYNLNDICTGSYGFQEWGPSLPTATYKTECLRKAKFKLLEKTFYVDMLYNAYSLLYIETVKRYDLNIYRYYIGNVGQSISADGMKRNYKHHEDVIIELMRIVTNDKRFTPQKREFVLRKLLLPMVGVQYFINLELFHSRKKLMVFEKRIHDFPELMNYSEFNGRKLKFHRRTKGLLVSAHPTLKRVANRLRRVR